MCRWVTAAMGATRSHVVIISGSGRGAAVADAEFVRAKPGPNRARGAGLVESRRVAAAVGAMSRAIGGSVSAMRRVVASGLASGGMRRLCSG